MASSAGAAPVTADQANFGCQDSLSVTAASPNGTTSHASAQANVCASSTSARRAAALMNAQRLIAQSAASPSEHEEPTPQQAARHVATSSPTTSASAQRGYSQAAALLPTEDDIDYDIELDAVHRKALRRAKAKVAAASGSLTAGQDENLVETDPSPTSESRRRTRTSHVLMANSSSANLTNTVAGSSGNTNGTKKMKWENGDGVAVQPALATDAGEPSEITLSSLDLTLGQSDISRGSQLPNASGSSNPADEVTTLRRQLVKQARANAVLGEEKAEAEAERRALQAQLAEVKRLLDVETARRQQQEKENAKLRSEYETMKSTVSDQMAKVESTREELLTAKQAMETLAKECQEKVAAAEARAAEKTNELAARNAEFQQISERLAKDLASAKIEVGCLQSKYNAAAAQLTAQSVDLERMSAAYEEATRKLADVTAESSALREQVETLQAKCNKYKETIVQFKEAVAEAAKDLKEQEDIIQSERAAREAAEAELQSTVNLCNATSEQVKAFQVDLAEKETMISTLESQLRETTETTTQLKAQLAEAEARADVLQAKNRELEIAARQLEQTKQELAECQALLESRTRELTDRLDEVECLKESLQQSESEYKTLQLDLQRRINNATEAEARIQELEHMLSETQAELGNAKDALILENTRFTELAASLAGRERAITEEAEARQASLAKEIQSLKLEIVAKDELRRQLHNELLDLKGSIRVFCRIRPAGKALGDSTAPSNVPPVTYATKPAGLYELLDVTTITESVTKEKRPKVYPFKFDRVFTASHTQQHLFDELTCFVTSALDGYSVSVFAYGQTGSGKTYTMTGPESCFFDPTSDGDYAYSDMVLDGNTQVALHPDRGIIPRAVEQIFSHVRAREMQQWKFYVRASMVEIYNEQIRDLLARLPGPTCSDHPLVELASICGSQSSNDDSMFTPATQSSSTPSDPNNCTLVQSKAGKVYVQDLKTIPVTSESDVYRLIREANKRRKMGATAANVRSSRSHTVFQLWIYGVYQGETPVLSGTESKSHTGTVAPCHHAVNPLPVSAVISLVDLAGSERLDKSQATGETLKESQFINTSLAALSQCMDAIAKKRDHIPYRNSKLTHLLKDSLGGSSKTLFVTNIAADAIHLQESLCTLRFAEALKSVELGPRSANPTAPTHSQSLRK